MATIVKMPKWGLTMTTGTMTGWLLDEGDEISRGQPLLTVETEKAVNDVEAPADGVLLRIVAQSGAEVAVSGAVAVIAAPNEILSDDELQALIAPVPTPGSAAPSDSASKRASDQPRRAPRAATNEGGRINASPAARKRATELGVDLATVEATGPRGRITSEDVERTAEATPTDPTPREEHITLADRRTLVALSAGAKASTNDPVLVFLHGLTGSLSTWEMVLGPLVEAHRVVAFDLPGHGQSDKMAIDDSTLTIDGITTSIIEGLGQIGISRALLVGHSLGGAVALQITRSNPELVQGLVLVSSAGLGPDISPQLIEVMAQPPGESTTRRLLQLFYADQSLVLDRGVAEMAQAQSAPGAWDAQQHVAQHAFAADATQRGVQDDLAEMNVPVLLVWGENDAVIPIRHAIESVSRFPDASLVVLSGIGHVPQVEQADRFARTLARFARSLTS